MRIGVISDTHAKTLREISPVILTALGGVDLIVHAGDFTDRAVLDGLRALGEVKAVCGNMDTPELKGILPPKQTFTAGGKKVGLTHGTGGPWGIADRIRDMFEDAELIIYGHSHEAKNEVIRGSLLFNPGQAKDSFGIIEINDEIKANIVQL